MRQFIQTLLFVVLLCASCQPSEAPVQETEPAAAEAEEPAAKADRATAEATIAGAQITVTYGRPELKGRDMLGMLGEGQVWRLGMNEATVFESDHDLSFADTVLKAGKYSIWAKKVNTQKWHLIFNSESDIWGTQRKPENDVVEVPAELTELAESMEILLMEVVPKGDQGAEIVVKWATLQIKIPFSVVSTPERSAS